MVKLRCGVEQNNRVSHSTAWFV